MELKYETTRDQALEARRAKFQRYTLIRHFKRFGWFVLPLCFFLYFLRHNLPFGDNATVNGEPAPLLGAIVSLPFIIGFGAAAGLASYFLLLHIGRGIVRKPIVKLPDSIFGERKVILDADGISICNPMVRTVFAWPLFEGFDEVQGYLLLKVMGSVVGLIPDRAFQDHNQRSEFLRILEEHSIRENPPNKAAEGKNTTDSAYQLSRRLGIYIYLPGMIIGPLLLLIMLCADGLPKWGWFVSVGITSVGMLGFALSRQIRWQYLLIHGVFIILIAVIFGSLIIAEAASGETTFSDIAWGLAIVMGIGTFGLKLTIAGNRQRDVSSRWNNT